VNSYKRLLYYYNNGITTSIKLLTRCSGTPLFLIFLFIFIFNENSLLGKSKLTIYTGDYGFLHTKSLQFVQRAKPRMIKIIHAYDCAYVLKQMSPNTIIIARRYLSNEPLEGDPEDVAQQWWDICKRDILNNPDVDYWVGYTEPPITNPVEMQWYGRFDAARVRILAEYNRKACIGNFKEDIPPPDENLALWEAYEPAIDAIMSHGGILGLHEEACPLNDCFVGDIATGEGRYTGLYRKVYKYYLQPNHKNIKIAITALCIEGHGSCSDTFNGKPCGGCCGWRLSGYSWEEYRDQLIWYDSLIKMDNYVIGAAIFCLEIPGSDTPGPMSFYYYDIGDPNLISWLTSYVSDGSTEIDLTSPTAPGRPQDDGAYTTSTTTLHFSWEPATDPESGIARYYLSIGTTPGEKDILRDKDVGNVTEYTVSGLNLTVGTTYYAIVKAENGEGLIGPYSEPSDGICVISETSPTINKNFPKISSLYPNLFYINLQQKVSIKYNVQKPSYVKIEVFDLFGRLVKTLANRYVDEPNVYQIYWDGKDEKGNKVPAGVYLVYTKIAAVTQIHKIVVIK